MLLRGDCLDLLTELPDNSVDSIVTDPPYELGFMGKSWDASGIAYNTDLWRECLRVLKPGGHLLAFGGTRTYHRIAVAIEDAGFEIRDSIHWTYGSGFPKSLDISKAIDKAAGAKREVVGSKLSRQPTGNAYAQDEWTKAHSTPQEIDITAPSTPEAQQWQGWGTALKPSHEPIVVARKPLVGTVANNVLTYGTGGLNIDGTRVGTDDTRSPASKTALGIMNDNGWQAQEVMAGSANGRWPANTVMTHHPDCEPAGEIQDTFGGGAKATSGFVNGYANDGFVGTTITTPVWNCVEGCPVLELDGQSGVRVAGRAPKNNNVGFGGVYTEGSARAGVHRDEAVDYGSGGASRYFTQTAYTEADYPAFLYYAKASKRERNQGLEGLPEGHPIGGADKWTEQDRRKGEGVTRVPTANIHPTVKPVELMRYLVRLVTPKGGTVLDPFLGSGTTAVAATLEGMEWIGCEMTEDYWPIIEGRVDWANQQQKGMV